VIVGFGVRVWAFGWSATLNVGDTTNAVSTHAKEAGFAHDTVSRMWPSMHAGGIYTRTELMRPFVS